MNLRKGIKCAENGIEEDIPVLHHFLSTFERVSYWLFLLQLNRLLQPDAYVQL